MAICRILFKVFFVCLVFCANPAIAQQPDANIAKLKGVFDELLSFQKSSLASSGMTLQFDGAVNVENAGKYYAVTLPHLSVAYGDGSKLDIGMVAVNASVHQEPGKWKMTLAVPTPMVFSDSSGVETGRLSIGGQSAAGIWSEALKNFSKLDANYESISLSFKKNAVEIVIPKTRVVYDLDEGAPGKWSGPVYFNFSNIAVSNATHKDVLKIGQLDLNIETFEFDQNGFAKYQKDLTAFIQNAEKNPAAAPSAAETQQLYNTFMAALGDGFTSQYQISDISIKGDETQDFTSIALGSASIGFDATGFLKDQVTLGLRLAYDGVKIEPAQAGIKKLVPSTLNLDWAVEKIPFKAVSGTVGNTLQGAGTQGDAMQFGAMSLLFKLPALLSQAGTSIVLENNKIANDIYQVDVNGKAIANLQAVNSATADVTMVIKGLDAILGILNAEASSPDASKADVTEAINYITMLKAMGAVDPAVAGETVHKYHFIMNEQGQMLLNGKDVMGQVMMGNPSAAPVPDVQPVPPAE
jgi:hypothetical protein